MNILVFEYITGGGVVNQPLPSSLVHEGEMMLRAVTNDFSRIADIRLTILKDYRLTAQIDEAKEISINPEVSSIQVIEAMANELDVVLVIAPETDNILASLCEKLEKHTFILCNANLESIKLTTDKYATYQYLSQYAIAQIPSYTLDELSDLQNKHKLEKYIVKSKDGVGCENLMIVEGNIDNAIAALEKDNYIIQPFVQGMAVSLSLLCWDGDCLVLTANEQILEQKNNSLNLKQCHVNSLDKELFTSFAEKLIKALPGLRGYVGVDIVIADNKIYLVEINPRLTTSYAGISAALGINLANLMLHCFVDKKLPPLQATCNDSFLLTLDAECAA